MLSLTHRLSFGPALGAAHVDTPMRRKRLDRFRTILIARSAFAYLTALAAVWLLSRLRASPARAGIGWDWQPLTVAGGALEWRMDGWSWLVSLLLILVTMACLALVGSDWPEDPARGRPGARLEWTLWLGAAALAFVFSANVITLVSAWVLLDAAIALRLRPGDNPAASSRAWSVLSAAAVIALLLVTVLGEEGVRSSLIGGSFGRLDMALLWVAVLIRAGVYPLHYWLTASPLPDPSDRVALHLVGPLTGLWLAGRVHQLTGPEQFQTPLWLTIGALALLGTALAAWTAHDEAVRWRWIMINRASMIVLTAYTASVAGPGAFVWLAAAFALGGALLALGQAWRTRWRAAPLGWLAALVVWGIPGTVGFLARSSLVYPTASGLAAPAFFSMLVAEVLLASSLWQIVVGAPESADDASETKARFAPDGIMPAWYLVVVLASIYVVMAALAVVWGLYPQRLAALSPWPGSETTPNLSQALIATRRSVWFGLAVSAAGGIALGVLRPRIFSGLRGWQELLNEVVSLDWLFRAFAGLLALLASGLRYFSILGEGDGYIGWLLLAGVILWVLLRA
jgi:hypothetical protein